MLRASLGVHVRCQVLHRYVRWIFSGYSSFRPPLINDRLDISEISLKVRKTLIFKSFCNYQAVYLWTACESRAINFELFRIFLLFFAQCKTYQISVSRTSFVTFELTFLDALLLLASFCECLAIALGPFKFVTILAIRYTYLVSARKGRSPGCSVG